MEREDSPHVAMAIELSKVPSSRRSAQRAQRWGAVSAAVAGGIGAFWLSLWLYGSSASQALASRNCKTNACIALLLLSTAYLCALRRPTGVPARLPAVLFVLAAGLGAATLLQYGTGVDLGIDELLMRDVSLSEAPRFPNRASPSAAACFVLLGLAGATIANHSRLVSAVGQACAAMALSIAGIALVGYLYSASILYQPLPFLRLSPYTAAAAGLLGVAAFALRPDVGVVRAVASTSIGGFLARRLLPITLLLPVIVGWLLLDARERTVLSPAESHALLATAVAIVMAPTVLFLALSLDRLERDRLEAEEFLHNASELTSALSRARSVQDVVTATLDLGLPALGARAGALLRLSEDGASLVCVASRGHGADVIEEYRSFPLDSPLPAAVAVSKREAVFLGSVGERDKRFPNLSHHNQHASWAALPLEGNSGPLGAIALSFTADQRFDRATRSRARQLAWQCAQALERALLYDSEQSARQRAEAASRAKDEFLAMLGHELRNPLSPILTSLHLMERRDPNASAKEREVIKRQVSHMVRLVDDLLDVSRIASGRIELRKRPVELAQVVGAAVELTAPLLQQRKHELVVDVAERGLLLDADLERMTQVVANLLTNAAKYTNVGGRISVRARRDDGSVSLRVSDNGVGIAPELLASVFDLFVQGARTLARSEGGLGLGLSLVKSLVSMHGGSVAALSEGPGKGSEFRVSLPALSASEPPSGPHIASAAATPSRPQRVLIVDDNRDAADSMAQALSELGHEVRVAYDGPSALAELGAFEPRLALLDIGLPGMDGYELARRLRALHGRDRLMLVAVTGYGQQGDRERSKLSGFDHHLVKPVSVADLTPLLGALS